MQAWVSCSGSRTTACDPLALGGDQCGEQRGPNIKHNTTNKVADGSTVKASGGSGIVNEQDAATPVKNESEDSA